MTKNGKIILWSGIGSGVALLTITALFIVTLGIDVSNREIGLRNAYGAELDHNKMVKNKTWKVVQQKANVLDKYSSDFTKAFTGLMNARYGGDDQVMFKWIQERNPNFSAEMYQDLSQAIESQSAEFLTVQTRLRDIKQEHDNLRLKFPSSLFVGSRTALEAVVIIADRVSKEFEAKVDSDTGKLF